MGIPRNEQSKISEKFYRANNAINITGTGLGLNFTKKMLALMGGTMTFKSVEGKGSTFF